MFTWAMKLEKTNCWMPLKDYPWRTLRREQIFIQKRKKTNPGKSDYEVKKSRENPGHSS